MTKEEVAQKRKDKETFYVYDGLNIIEIIPSEVENIIILSNTIEVIWNEFYTDYYKYDNIFNTRAEAQHYLDNGNVVRTEKLPYITWEEFKNDKSIEFRDGCGHSTLIKMYIDHDYNAIVVESDDVLGFDLISCKDLTEENFYKAYEVCRKLFLGEE